MLAWRRDVGRNALFHCGLRVFSGALRRAVCLALLSGSAFALAAAGETGAGTDGATAAQTGGVGGSASDGNTTADRPWAVIPQVSIKETYSDNVNLSATNPQSDWITEIAPGVTVRGRTKRLKMHLAYGLHQMLYAQGSKDDQTQQSLNAFGTLEAIDRFLFVDMNGNITQQRISAFGSQSAGNYSANNNSTETSTYRLSPYIKGRLGGYVDYEGRYTRTALRNKSSLASDFDSEDWLGKLSGDTPLTVLGWSVDAERKKYDYRPGRPNTSEHQRGSVYLRITPELRLSLSAGRERNDFLGAEMASYTTHGVGLDWHPTDRTEVSLSKEKRFFGYGHMVTISHRMRHSSFRYTDSRDVSVLPNQSGLIGLGTYYDLLFAQLAPSIPDETTRAAAVNTFLSDNNIPANAVVTTDFLSSQATLQRRQELTYILTGVRNVVTISLVESRKELLGTMVVTGLANDFSNNSLVIQRGINVGWAHRLSELSSLNITALRSRSDSATNDVDHQTTQKMLAATISTRLGSKTQGSLMLRRTLFSNFTVPYAEDAVIGTISIEF